MLGQRAVDLVLEPDPNDLSVLPECARTTSRVDVETNDYRGEYTTRIEGKDVDPNTGQAANWVSVTYETGPGMWHLMRTITDSTGRTITFTNEMLPGADMGVVRRIDLPAFGGQRAVYELSYEVATIMDPFVYEVPYGTVQHPVQDPNDPSDGVFLNIPLLTSIDFPHGYRMSFEYLDEENENVNFGLLQARVLPTGARVEYDFRSYPFQHKICRLSRQGTCPPGYGADMSTFENGAPKPTINDPSSCGTIEGPLNDCTTPEYPGTFGVEAKRVIVEPGAVPATWRWKRREFAMLVVAGQPTTLSNPWKVVSTDPLGNDSEAYYHATLRPLDPNIPEERESNDPWWKNGMVKARAYFRGSSDSGGNPVRWEVLTWEDEDYGPYVVPHHKGHFTRIKESKTFYADDAGRSTRTVNNDWDGFGHYRETSEYGFDGLPYQTKRTGYNCDARDPNGTCVPDAARLANWVLDTHAYEETRDAAGAVLERSELEHDELGYLLARKDALDPASSAAAPASRSGQPGDVVRLYCYEGYSGDSWCPPGSAAHRNGQVRFKRLTVMGADGTPSAAPDDAFDETYTYQGPYLATRRNAGMDWLAEDRVVDPATGLASLTRDPSGVTTRFAYDVLGRLTEVTPDSVNGQEAPARLAYPDVRTTTLTQETAPGVGIFSRFGFDGLGRLVKVEKRQSDGSLALQVTRYDAVGRKLFESEWGDPNRGTTYDYTDPYSPAEQPAQDAFNRVRKQTAADGAVTRFDYAGLSSTTTVEGIETPAGVVSASTYYGRDAFGRLTQVLSPRVGPALSPAGADAQYRWDALDRLAQVKLEGPDPDGGAEPLRQYRYFAYDALGRQVSSVSPEAGLTRNLAFDAAGHVLLSEDAAGNRLAFRYDGASRPTETWLTLPGWAPRLVAERRYDAPGIAYGRSAGKLTSVTSYDDEGRAVIAERRSYEGLNGRLSGRFWQVGGWSPNPATPLEMQPELAMTLAYDALGLVSQMVYPELPGSGRLVTSPRLTYTNGYLTQVSDPVRGGLVSAIEYNAAGGVRRLVTRGEVQTLVEPDERNRPRSITVTGPPPPPPPPPGGGGGGPGGGGGVIRREYSMLSSPARLIGQSGAPVTLFTTGRYHYDGAGSIVAMGDAGAPRDTFFYDAVNRLVGASMVNGTKVEDLRWAFDPFGNMTLQERTTTSAAGSTARESRFTVSPQRNQIASYTTGAPGAPATVTARYDANGNLVEDGAWRFQYDARNRLAQAYEADGRLVARYAYDADGYRISKLDAATGTTTYYLRDLDGRVLSEFGRPAGLTASTQWAKDYVYAASRHVASVENETPAAPGGLVSTASRPGETPFVSLTWTQNPDLDLLKYRVHREGAGLTQVFDHIDLGETAFWDASANPGVQYTYWLTAVDRAGRESAPSASVRVTPGDAEDPEPPTGMAAQPGDGKVELSWTAPIDPQGDLLGYRVHRSDDGGASWSPKGDLFRVTRVTDLSVDNERDYLYRVVSVDTAGRTSAASATASAVPHDATPPEPPAGLYAVPEVDPASSMPLIALAWRASRADDVVSYRVYRLDWAQPASSGATLYADSAVASGQTYRYQVTAVDEAGNESVRTDPVAVVASDPAVPVPLLTRVGWDYACRDNSLYCRLPQNFLISCSWGTCVYAHAQHENLRSVQVDVVDPNAVPGGLRLYRRAAADDAWELLRDLPPPGEPSAYPQFSWGTISRSQAYYDFVADPADARGQTRYRVSALGSAGQTSGMSGEVVLPPAILAPENLMIPAEALPFDPYLGTPLPDAHMSAEATGLTLTWTPGGVSCGGTLRGYHAWRARTNGFSWPEAATPQRPQIRLTREPVDAPSLRVELPLLDQGMLRSLSVFPGPLPAARLASGADAPAYAVTAVDALGNESVFSDAVRAHPAAENATDACVSWWNPCSGDTNTEYPAASGFVVPDPAQVQVPGAPGDLSWTWRYTSAAGDSFGTLTPQRNWPLVTWDLPAGAPNEYVLLRQTGADQEFHEVELPMIAGDYAGVPWFLESPPLELACVDANYAVVAKDLFGRPGPMSNVVSVFRYRLIPENVRGQAAAGQVSVSWDALPACGEDPGFVLTGYTVVRSTTAVSGCDQTSMPADPAAYTVVGTVGSTQTSLWIPTPPGGPAAAYWYRVKSAWGDACGASVLSAGICLSADGSLSGRSSRFGYAQSGALAAPTGVTVPAEAIDPNDMTNPAYHGLDLTWVEPAPMCESPLKGYHVWRSRWNGTAYAGPPIRVTPQDQPATGTRHRVSFPPIPAVDDPLNPGVPEFAGPPGYKAGTEMPPTYRLTSVSVLEQEGGFSAGLRAHANATTATVDWQDPATAGPMNERSGAAAFAAADPADESLVPAAPSGLSWSWFYGRRYLADVVPEDRDWALVKWSAPATGVVNEYRLERKRAADADFNELPSMDVIPGDDLGVRQFVWAMPLELACEPAEYRVVGVDVFGRPGPASPPLTVGAHNLTPEATRLDQPAPMQLRLVWDLLPACGQDPNHLLREYVVMRSAEVTKCLRRGPDPDTVWEELGTTPATQGFFDLPAPPYPLKRYWYVVKARWGETSGQDSAASFAACGTFADGQLLEDDDPPPEAHLRLPDDPDSAARLAAALLGLPLGSDGAVTPIFCPQPAVSDGIQPDVIYPDGVQPSCPPSGSASAHRVIGQSCGSSPCAVTPEVRLTFYHLDHLGTPRVITDEAGQPISKHKYLPFGEELDPSPSTNTHKFTGHERDAETGLDYMLARHYSAALARFGSADSAAESVASDSPQTWNRYAYVRNNPLGRNDPTGKVDNATIKADFIAAGGRYGELGPAWSPEEAAFRKVMGIALGALAAAPLALAAPELAAAATNVVLRHPEAGVVAYEALAAATDNPSALQAGRAAASLGEDVVRNGIRITESSAAHVLSRHFPGGAETSGKSVFAVGESLPSLVRSAEQVAPTPQQGGNLQRVVDAGRIIGIDRATGLPTSIYTVITDTVEYLVTMFPGLP